MRGAPTFEEFENDTHSVGQLVEEARESVEDQKLRSFEDGYNAGWQDSVDAQTKTQTFLAEHVTHALKEMKLTQRDAIEDALKTTLVAFSEIVKIFLPSLTSEHVHTIVLDVLRKKNLIVEDIPLSISTSAEDYSSIHGLLASQEVDLKVTQNAHLGTGQIVVTTGLETIEIDLRDAAQSVLSELGNLMKTLHEETGDV